MCPALAPRRTAKHCVTWAPLGRETAGQRLSRLNLPGWGQGRIKLIIRRSQVQVLPAPPLYPSGIPINRLSSRNTPTTKAPMNPRSIEVLSLSGRCFHRSKSRSHHLSSPSPSRSSTLPPRPNPLPTCVSARMLDHFSPRRRPEPRPACGADRPPFVRRDSNEHLQPGSWSNALVRSVGPSPPYAPEQLPLQARSDGLRELGPAVAGTSDRNVR
jgi:hypothetical protein